MGWILLFNLCLPEDDVNPALESPGGKLRIWLGHQQRQRYSFWGVRNFCFILLKSLNNNGGKQKFVRHPFMFVLFTDYFELHGR